VPVTEIEKLLLEYKRSENRWIGLEVERLGVDPRGRFLRYQTDYRRLLSDLMSSHGWKVDYQVGSDILGISKELSAISLEPGSQFELSLAPRQSLHEVMSLQAQLDQEILGFDYSKDWRFLGLGLNPLETPDQIELLPSPRYALMDRHFKTNGTRGREMMRLSAGLQVNLDFASEAEAIEMLRAGFYMAPFLASFFSNSPRQNSKTTGRLSERHFVWRETDPARSGFLDFVFDPNFSFKDYSRHICSIPLMYAYDESGNAFDSKGASLCELPNELVKKNALAAMRQLFTEIRLKPCCVELRYFDQVPSRYRMAAVALCVGLLYDDENRSQLVSKSKKVSSLDLRKLMKEGAETGLKSDQIYTELCKLVNMTIDELHRRNYNEEVFLKDAEILLSERKTPAEIWLEAGAGLDGDFLI